MPRQAFVPIARTRPPTTIVGSRPAAWRIDPVIEVVVVLPCEPAMAMPVFTRITSASISARLMTGTPAIARRDELGVVLGDGGGVDDDVGPGHVLGAVPRREDRDAEGPEPAGLLPLAQVRAR